MISKTPVDLDHLMVVPRFDVRGDPPLGMSVRAKGGLRYLARLNPHGAVSAVISDGVYLGLKPGEFDFECPEVEGATTTELEEYGGKRFWTIWPHSHDRVHRAILALEFKREKPELEWQWIVYYRERL
jgi:hypothetical protein